MARTTLKLVEAADVHGQTPGFRRAWPLALILLLGAWIGWSIDVDPVRHPVAPRELATRTLAVLLEQGADSPAARQTLIDLRQTLGRRPLDSRSRVVYAELLLVASRRLSDTRAAVAHALQAAELAPVTVPVVRKAAMVLTRARRTDLAAKWIRDMFGYAPEPAAELLSQLDPLLTTAELAVCIPETPEAWLAWSATLRGQGRVAEAERWIERVHARWPEHLPALQWLASRALQRGDWATLADLLPDDRALPETPQAGIVTALRGRLRSHRGDVAGARDDAGLALRLDPGSNYLRMCVGDVYADLGDDDDARRQWQRALFDDRMRSQALRSRLLIRLARLEDREGEPLNALHLWRSLLELDPQNTEAERRVAELAGAGSSTP